MNTEERANVRGALIAKGFARYWVPNDDTSARVISAVHGVDPDKRREGAYTEFFRHYDGTVVSVSWAPKSHLPTRNC